MLRPLITCFFVEFSFKKINKMAKDNKVMLRRLTSWNNLKELFHLGLVWNQLDKGPMGITRLLLISLRSEKKGEGEVLIRD